MQMRILSKKVSTQATANSVDNKDRYISYISKEVALQDINMSKQKYKKQTKYMLNNMVMEPRDNHLLNISLKSFVFYFLIWTVPIHQKDTVGSLPCHVIK